MLTTGFVLTLYAYVLLVFAAVYLCGHVLTAFFNLPPGRNLLFLKLTTGLIFLPTCFALARSEGHTILAVNLALAAGIVLSKYRSHPFSVSYVPGNLFRPDRDLLPVILFLTIVFIFNLGLLFDFSDGSLLRMKESYAYYARLSGYLRDTGIESRRIEYFIRPFVNRMPFHYAEGWFTAGVSTCTGLHVQYALQLVTFPVVFACVYAGLIKLVASVHETNNTVPRLRTTVVAALFFVVSMFGFLYPTHLHSLQADAWTATLIRTPALSFVYLFMVWLFISLRADSYCQASMVCCFAAVSYTGVLPGLFLSYGAFLVYRMARNRSTSKDLFKCLVPLAVTTGLIGFFYLYQTHSGFIATGDLQDARHELFGLTQTTLHIVVKTMLQVLITSAPYLLLLLFLRKEMFSAEWEVTLFWICTSVFSLLSWALFNISVDAVQFWADVYMPVANLLGWFLLVVLLNRRNAFPRKVLVASLFFAVNLASHIPLQMAEAPVEAVSISGWGNGKSPKIACIRDAGSYSSYEDKNEYFHAGLTYSLMRGFDPLLIAILPGDSTLLTDPDFVAQNSQSAFMRFCAAYSAGDPGATLGDAEGSFVDTYGIEYLLVPANRKIPRQFTGKFNPVAEAATDGYNIYKRLKNNSLN